MENMSYRPEEELLSPPPGDAQLTDFQTKILDGIGQNLSYAEIAEQEGTTSGSVRSTVSQLRNKGLVPIERRRRFSGRMASKIEERQELTLFLRDQGHRPREIATELKRRGIGTELTNLEATVRQDIVRAKKKKEK